MPSGEEKLAEDAGLGPGEAAGATMAGDEEEGGTESRGGTPFLLLRPEGPGGRGALLGGPPRAEEEKAVAAAAWWLLLALAVLVVLRWLASGVAPPTPPPGVPGSGAAAWGLVKSPGRDDAPTGWWCCERALMLQQADGATGLVQGRADRQSLRSARSPRLACMPLWHMGQIEAGAAV